MLQFKNQYRIWAHHAQEETKIAKDTEDTIVSPVTMAKLFIWKWMHGS